MNPKTGYIDYDKLEENARLFHPKLIIAGKEQPLHTSRGGILKPVGNCSGMLQNYRIESLNNPSWKGPTGIQLLAAYRTIRNPNPMSESVVMILPYLI